MSRYDNEDLAGLGIPEPSESLELHFGKNGTEVDIQDSVAKIVEQGEAKAHFIWFGRGDLFDPYGTDRLHKNRPYYSFKKVTEQTFGYYFKYLESKNNLYLTRARRSSMEE
jgi:hypothetical protein